MQAQALPAPGDVITRQREGEQNVQWRDERDEWQQ
jgi:hypothetical protein